MRKVQKSKIFIRTYLLGNFTILQKISTSINWNIFKRRFIFSPIGLSAYRVKNRSSGFELHFPFREISKPTWFQLSILKTEDFFFKHYRSKYLYDGFVIPPGWDVIDCGAYIGGFSMSVASHGIGRVFALEPSHKNFESLVKNLELLSLVNLVIPIEIGLGDKNVITEMSISGSGQDNSVLGVDSQDDDLNEKQVVKLQRLDDFAAGFKVDGKKCFLKIEAEGFEIEVIQGFGSFRPQVISVDVSPERFGESPLSSIQKSLTEMGYKCIPPMNNGNFPVALLAYFQQ